MRYFSGRAGRVAYLFGLVAPTAAFFAITWAFGLLQVSFGDLRINLLFYILTLVSLALMTLAWFSAVVKRLHDLGQTGWLSLLGLIPVVNLAGGALLLFLPGQPQINRYGPPPPNITVSMWAQ